MRPNPSPLFEQSALEVIDRLQGDYSSEAYVLREEAATLVQEFRGRSAHELIDVLLVSRLFVLYRRAMSYLIDSRQEFWQNRQRPK